MNASEISGEDSLRRWLEDQPHEIAVILAHRAAMRVAPLCWHRVAPVSGKDDLTALDVCRANLICGVAGIRPTPQVKAAAASASAAAINAVRRFSTVGAAAAQCAADAAALAPVITDSNSASAANAAACAVDDLANVAARSARSAASGGDWADPFAAVAAAAAAQWRMIAGEAGQRGGHGQLLVSGLWRDAKNPLQDHWQSVAAAWRQAGPDWEFWIRWYQAALDGQPLHGSWDAHWHLLERIALHDPATWDAGPTAVATEIRRIEAEFDGKAAAAAFAEVLNATLYDFRFDQMAGVMRAVPLEEDWKHLRDPAQLASFLSDAQDLLDSLDLLAQALEAEGTAMQGAGAVRTYLTAVAIELRNAKAADLLRVDKLMELGRILETMAGRDSVEAEFGVLAEPLRSCIDKLRDLVRRHFAHTLARMTPLRDLHMEPDANPWEVLRDFRDVVAGVKSGAGGTIPRLAGEDAAILDDILDSVEIKIRDFEATNRPDSRSSLRREIDFQMAKVGATGSLYYEKAARAVGKSGQTVDTGMKWEKRGVGLAKWADWLKDLFDMSGGGA